MRSVEILKFSVNLIIMFSEILSIIYNAGGTDFEKSCNLLENCINSDSDFTGTLRQIGIIPENIAHDSTQEKLFSKASDMVLSRAFRELGLKSAVIKARADSADVLAESELYGYTLVSDAKAFRLSRTAKNQKDFKVSALSSWRKDNDYAVLCAPYFQYPAKTSQIYSQALSNNVCLLSWEHIVFMIELGIKESSALNLSEIWNFSSNLSHKVLVSDMKKNILPDFNIFLVKLLNTDIDALMVSMHEQISFIIERSKTEKSYWLERIRQIKNYSREQAVIELIKSLGILEKIAHIDAYINTLQS